MAKQKTFEDFFVDELKDLYSAEKQITKALPKMVKAASSEELKEAFQNHLKETENQIARLEKISTKIGKSLSGKKCVAMEGLIKEGAEIMEENMQPSVMDVALICAGQKVEHYEIASYGCALTYADLLGYDDISKLLNETMDEEKNADKTLSEIAGSVNAEAMNEETETSSFGTNGKSKSSKK
ncbi:MAG: ferritin-like domain-containing protein [bacterium]|nr:ferritin-like domain-containing protein [bacterium]